MDPTAARDEPTFATVFARCASALTRSELRVAQFVRQHPETAVVSSAAALGRLTETSDATVLRTVKALGYPGLRAMQSALVDQLRRHVDLPTQLAVKMSAAPGPDSVLSKVGADSVAILQELLGRLPDDAWTRTIEILDRSRYVLCFGLGQAGPPAQQLALSLVRLGKPALAVSDSGVGLADRLALLDGDGALVVFGMLRMFREIGTALDHARSIGVRTVVITEALARDLKDRADVVLTTPASTGCMASESLAPAVLAHALSIELARLRAPLAASNAERLESLRAKIIGRSPGA